MYRRIAAFREQIESEQFYEAHEALEEAWFPRRFEADNEVKILKGFINAAVSFELKKRGRDLQSKKVWANYLKYRQFILTTPTPYKNEFYQLSRYLEKKNRENH